MNRPNARVGTVSGTSISWGTESEMNTYESNAMDMAYDPDTQRIIGVSKDQSGSEARIHVGTVSGTDITWGANNAIDAGQPSYYPTVAYDTTNNKVVIQYETIGAQTKYKVGTVTGGSTNTISWSSEGTVSTTDYNNQEIFFDSFTERLVSFVRDSNGDVYVASGSLSGSTITWTSFYKIEDDTVPNEYLTGVVLQNGIVALIAQNGGGWFESDSAILGTASSNATTDNFIGFARDGVAGGVTAKIDVSGAVNASQSGLTAGEKYYVQKNGSLATTEDTPKVFAGTAISASKLIVNDQQPVPTISTPALQLVESFVSPNSAYVTFDNLTKTNVSYYLIKWTGVTFDSSYSTRNPRAQFKIGSSWLTANSTYNQRHATMEFFTSSNEFYSYYDREDLFLSKAENGSISMGEMQIPMQSPNVTNNNAGDKYCYGKCINGNYMNEFYCNIRDSTPQTGDITGVRFFANSGNIGYSGRFDLYKYVY